VLPSEKASGPSPGTGEKTRATAYGQSKNRSLGRSLRRASRDDTLVGPGYSAFRSPVDVGRDGCLSVSGRRTPIGGLAFPGL
jgi:hypothetical protein